MRLTSFTDYSLRVLMYLGVEPSRRATIGEIAAAFDISEHHLVKVVHFLGKAGWLRNVRGKGGGLELALAPAQVNLGAVVRDTEGDAVVAECFDAGRSDNCIIAGSCKLRGPLDEAIRAFYAVLDGYTLADVVRNRDQLARVLFFPDASGRRRA